MLPNYKWVNTLNDMTSGYFGFTLPTEMWLKVLDEEPIIETELAYDAITDTAVRDIVINTVCRVIGLRDWPTYGEHGLMAKFIKEFESRIKEVGGTYE